MDIAKELKENKTILLLIPGDRYNEVVLTNIRHLAKKNVGYITLNKTFEALKETFKAEGVAVENITFVDAITKTIKNVPSQIDGCYYVSSPAALTELSVAVSKLLNHRFDYIVIDSVTNLLVYQNRAPVGKFLSSIANRTRESGSRTVFYALEADRQEELITECSMFVDKVLGAKTDKAKR
jgi:archaellum biogenesis ATPase FlaH